MIKVLIKKNRVKCCCCGSILKYDTEDLKPVMYGTENEVHYWKIICPICKGNVRVSD